MTLRLYNTLTKTKEDFAPLDPANVRMYVCGPTVYDFAHIGNARPAIVFDVLYRLLKHLAARGEWDGGKGRTKVTYVRNITDVDDKINARAKEIAAQQNISVEQARTELTKTTERQYVEDVTALGCLPPTFTPRATEHIPEMLEIINRLQSAQLAYASTTAEDTDRNKRVHVLFDVSRKPDYGKLSRRSLDEMIAGARVEVAPYKKNPMDFVLWKPSEPDQPGWDSRFGRGRPGWHIECSAMAGRYLGETFDIHGGGIDLMFPHHENEIAQSEGAHHGHALAKVWMHNGFLQVEGEKMSKSLGNFFTIRQLLEGMDFGGRLWSGDICRFAMLQTHYRQPIDWTVEGLKVAERTLARWKDVLNDLSVSFDSTVALPALFESALGDDLNLPQAISEMHKLADEGRKGNYNAAQQLARAGEFMGISWLNVQSRVEETELRQGVAQLLDEDGAIQARIIARNAARKAKNFAESDRIRDELFDQGIVLKDGPTGTTWEVRR